MFYLSLVYLRDKIVLSRKVPKSVCIIKEQKRRMSVKSFPDSYFSNDRTYGVDEIKGIFVLVVHIDKELNNFGWYFSQVH